VKKAYDDYIKPTMKYANIIVPFGSDNTTAIDFIVTNLRSKLQEQKHKSRKLSLAGGISANEGLTEEE
jgi:uridine kinase